ncbi:MAG: 50S ribosomal protein L21 [Deltaproteobacteria bacterium]|nr:50S ribosomal protein L21 [Deltaproteobacteria bacterium]MBW2672695.1 50S ribosomal protein L21 [Deltaproteobacteria bacterium]
MYAVIKTGGKQYKVSAGDVLNFEKIEGGKGDIVAFDEVLLVSGDKEVTIGTPFVEGAKVVGEIISQIRGPKIVVFKMKRRKGYSKKTGHRQDLTSLKIKEIVV